MQWLWALTETILFIVLGPIAVLTNAAAGGTTKGVFVKLWQCHLQLGIAGLLLIIAFIVQLTLRNSSFPER